MNYTKSLLFILVFISMYGCSNDDSTPVAPVTNELNIEFDGQNYQFLNEAVFSNENCRQFYITSSFYERDGVRFRITFNISNSGEILQVRFNLYNDVNEHFKILNSHAHDIKSTFAITDFLFDSQEKSIKFNFDGLVINTSNNADTKNIKGSVNINSYIDTDCQIGKSELISQDEAGIHLYSMTLYRSKNTRNEQVHNYYTTNGYHFTLNSNDDFWNLPLGDYPFDVDTSTIYMTARKYTGPLVAQESSRPSTSVDWVNYKTRGILKIENKSEINDRKEIQGSISVELLENDNLVTTYNNIQFYTGSFLD